jgi:hypothetical protein
MTEAFLRLRYMEDTTIGVKQGREADAGLLR